MGAYYRGIRDQLKACIKDGSVNQNNGRDEGAVDDLLGDGAIRKRPVLCESVYQTIAVLHQLTTALGIHRYL